MSYNPSAGGISDGDKGDLVVSSGGTVFTVDTGAVTTDKLGGDVTTAGKSLLTSADATAQRTALGLSAAGVMSSAFLANTQANSTVTPATLTGATFVVGPGKRGVFTAVLIVTSAATTTGVGAGFRVAQASGANGNARGSWFGYVNVANAPAATGLSDGDVYNVAANANTYGELLGTASTSGNNAMMAEAIVVNTSSNADTTVTFEFRSEVATSAVTAQIGSGVVALIG